MTHRLAHILLLSLVFLLPSKFQSFQFPIPFTTPIPSKTKDANVVVIVPGFLTSSTSYLPLAQSLAKRNIPAVIVPLSIWHWIPCMMNGCVSPILKRLDHTVQHVCTTLANKGGIDEMVIPEYEYSVLDCVQDLINRKSRNIKDEMEECSSSSPMDGTANVLFGMAPPSMKNNNNNTNQVRICLVGHSAGGWISRVYLSNRPYYGKAYKGSNYVHSLVTLGTPHLEAPANPAFRDVQWCNRESLPIRGIAVAGVGSWSHLSGLWTKHSYAFCGAQQDEEENNLIDGDGMTPVHSALAMKGKHVQRVTLNDVTHYPWKKRWYGDDDVVDSWAGYLMKRR
mmetsp:Transcript_13490/g.18090  ORF Transcript_13490/g.18090 Transcript_13490/m.18090 type:complete len:338 (+) Transcript_13490:118-1131(+)